MVDVSKLLKPIGCHKCFIGWSCLMNLMYKSLLVWKSCCHYTVITSETLKEVFIKFQKCGIYTPDNGKLHEYYTNVRRDDNKLEN